MTSHNEMFLSKKYFVSYVIFLFLFLNTFFWTSNFLFEYGRVIYFFSTSDIVLAISSLICLILLLTYITSYFLYALTLLPLPFLTPQMRMYLLNTLFIGGFLLIAIKHGIRLLPKEFFEYLTQSLLPPILGNHLLRTSTVIILLFSYLGRRKLSRPLLQKPFLNNKSFHWSMLLILTATALHTTVVFFSDPPISTPVPPTQHNVILIVFDGLGRDHLSAYGYERNTSPIFDRLTKKSYLFKNAWSNTHETQTSIAVILTGTMPHDTEGKPRFDTNNIVDHDKNILMALQHYQYDINVITSHMNASPHKKNMSYKRSSAEWLLNDFKPWSANHFDYPFFQTLAGVSLINLIGMPVRKLLALLFSQDEPIVLAQESFDAATLKLKYMKHHPFFLYLHVFTPHVPFIAPKEFQVFKEKFREGDINAYDNFVHYLDFELGTFLNYLEQSSLLENTILILTADHGHRNLFQFSDTDIPIPKTIEWFGIPLLIHLPGQTEGHVIQDDIYSVNIAPTILGLLNIPVPQWMERDPYRFSTTEK